jgi:hypothetical protein
MDKQEARSVLAKEMATYRSMSYSALCGMLDETLCVEITGPSGATYQIEIALIWDDRPGGALHVIGAIDDGGWSAFSPLTDGFLLRPDGTFVGE